MLGLFSGELVFGGAYYWTEVCLKHHENSLKQLKTANTTSPWAYIREELSEGFFASEIWRAYFREGLFLEGFIIGILRYNIVKNKENGLHISHIKFFVT